jgi:hypothetical protein
MPEMSDFINPNNRWHGCTMPHWLMQMEGLSFGAKVLYAKLAFMAGENGHCWPSQEQLAGELNVQLRVVQRFVSELKDAKLIVTKKQVIGNLLRNVYHFYDVTDLSACSRQICRHVPDENVGTFPTNMSVSYIGRKEKAKEKANVYSGQPKVAGGKTEPVNFVHFKKLLRAKVNMMPAHGDLRSAIVEFVNGLEGKVQLGGAALNSYINELANEINTVIADEKDFSVKLVQSCVGKKKIFGSKIGLLKYAAFNPYGSIAFRDAWAKWLDYRAQHKIKSYASPDSMNAVIRKHAELCGTEAAFIQSIEQSIANTWQGLFVPKKSPAAGPVRYTSGIEKETNIYNMARKLAGLPDVYPDTNQKQIT